jgi:hypothetical protein
LQDCKQFSRGFDSTRCNRYLSDQTLFVGHEFAPSSA